MSQTAMGQFVHRWGWFGSVLDNFKDCLKKLRGHFVTVWDTAGPCGLVRDSLKALWATFGTVLDSLVDG